MSKITIVDVQHKQFKKKLNGYDPADVDQYLDEIIETLEDEAQKRAALEAEISDLRERISHFKAMEESLHNTLLLAQRTADEVKANAHKEADLIRHEARISVEKEISTHSDRANEARRDHQRAVETAEKAKSELRSLLMTHLSLLERTPIAPIPVAGVPASMATNGASSAVASSAATVSNQPAPAVAASAQSPGPAASSAASPPHASPAVAARNGTPLASAAAEV